MFLPTFFQHKKQLLLKLSDGQMRYPQLDQKGIFTILCHGRHIRIQSRLACQWIALETDASLYIHYLSKQDDPVVVFTLHNEKALWIYAECAQQQIIYSPVHLAKK